MRDLRAPLPHGGRANGAIRGGARGAAAAPSRDLHIGMLAETRAELVWAAQASVWAPSTARGVEALREAYKPGRDVYLIFRELASSFIMVRLSSTFPMSLLLSPC